MRPFDKPVRAGFALLAACLAQPLAAQIPLSEAQRLARDTNPIIVAAGADVDAAEAAFPGRVSPYRPTFGFSLFGGRSEGMPMDMGFGLQMLEGSGAGGNAMFSWKLFSGGRDRTAGDLAANGIAMARSRAKIVWLDLLEEVRLEFAEAAQMQDEVDAVKAMVESAQELERITVQAFESGKLPEAFVFGARADRLKAEGELARVEAALLGALARIAACCGIEITGGRVGEWDVPMELPDSLEAAIELAISRSPDVAMHDQRAREWALVERMALQSGQPDVRLVGAAGQTFAGGMRDSGTQAGLLLSWPIGDGGMRRAEAAEARKRRVQEESASATAKNDIRASLTAAWAQWEAAPRLLEAARGMVASAEEGYRIAKLRYEEGKTIRAEMSQALADRLDARNRLAQAEAYRRMSWSRVSRELSAG